MGINAEVRRARRERRGGRGILDRMNRILWMGFFMVGGGSRFQFESGRGFDGGFRCCGNGLDGGGFALGVGDGEVDLEAGDGLGARWSAGFEFFQFGNRGDDAAEIGRIGILD